MNSQKITKATGKLYQVIIITRHYTQTNRLKKLLKARNIASKTLYDVYVGGLNSYNETIEFEKALIKKGYHIYSIKNIDLLLLYYINIAKNINESLKNRYMALWKNTGFKIVLYRHTKKSYRYETICRLDKNLINLLKKRRHFISSSKNTDL